MARRITAIAFALLVLLLLIAVSGRLSDKMLTVVCINETGKPLIIYGEADIPGRGHVVDQSATSSANEPGRLGFLLYGQLPTLLTVRTEKAKITFDQDTLERFLKNNVLFIHVFDKKLEPQLPE